MAVLMLCHGQGQAFRSKDGAIVDMPSQGLACLQLPAWYRQMLSVTCECAIRKPCGERVDQKIASSFMRAAGLQGHSYAGRALAHLSSWPFTDQREMFEDGRHLPALRNAVGAWLASTCGIVVTSSCCARGTTTDAPHFYLLRTSDEKLTARQSVHNAPEFKGILI